MILPRKLSHSPHNVKHPVTKSSQSLHKTPPDPDKYPQDLYIYSTASYNTLIHSRSTLMSVAYQSAQKVRYRITLDVSAFPDFDPHQIDWDKLFKLEPAEKCEAYVEDLSLPDRWWFSAVSFDSITPHKYPQLCYQNYETPKV